MPKPYRSVTGRVVSHGTHEYLRELNVGMQTCQLSVQHAEEEQSLLANGVHRAGVHFGPRNPSHAHASPLYCHIMTDCPATPSAPSRCPEESLPRVPVTPPTTTPTWRGSAADFISLTPQARPLSQDQTGALFAQVFVRLCIDNRHTYAHLLTHTRSHTHTPHAQTPS